MRSPNVLLPLAEWRDPRHRLGLAGEVAAARFLEAAGFMIEAHRFRMGHHDLDLVARQGTLVAFVEVKSRRTTAFGHPAGSIGWRRRRDLARLATLWVMRHGRAGDRYRFDVVTVQWEGPGFPHVSHIADAWRVVEK
jgi:putative endonuclease